MDATPLGLRLAENFCTQGSRLRGNPGLKAIAPLGQKQNSREAQPNGLGAAGTRSHTVIVAHPVLPRFRRGILSRLSTALTAPNVSRSFVQSSAIVRTANETSGTSRWAPGPFELI